MSGTRLLAVLSVNFGCRPVTCYNPPSRPCCSSSSHSSIQYIQDNCRRKDTFKEHEPLETHRETTGNNRTTMSIIRTLWKHLCKPTGHPAHDVLRKLNIPATATVRGFISPRYPNGTFMNPHENTRATRSSWPCGFGSTEQPSSLEPLKAEPLKGTRQVR